MKQNGEEIVVIKNKADLERALKKNAAGMALKEVRVKDVTNDITFFIEDVEFDEDDNVVYIKVK